MNAIQLCISGLFIFESIRRTVPDKVPPAQLVRALPDCQLEVGSDGFYIGCPRRTIAAQRLPMLWLMERRARASERQMGHHLRTTRMVRGGRFSAGELAYYHLRLD